MSTSFDAWAISIPVFPGRRDFIGRFFFQEMPHPSHRGGRIALFETRTMARKYMARIEKHWRPRIERVRVSIEAKP